MLNLSKTEKRVTWRLSRDVHVKINKIAKSADLTLEEVGNLIMQSLEWDDVKDNINRYRAEKKAAEARRKKATETVSQLDPDVLDKLSGLDPADIAKMLSD